MQNEEGIQTGKMGGLEKLIGRKYYLCIEDRYAAAVMQEWIRLYKPAPLQFRAANEKKGIHGCFVLGIKDEDGKHLNFIEKIARMTDAKIEVV